MSDCFSNDSLNQTDNKYNFTGSKAPSRRSRSTISVSNSELLRQRAKVEAAQTSLNFALREIELEKRQAEIIENESNARAAMERRSKDIQADLVLLQKEKEAAIAQAELDIMFEGSKSSSSIHSYRTRSVASTKLHRTERYVAEQSILNDRRSENNTFTVRNETEPPHVPNAYCSVTPNPASDFAGLVLKRDLLLSRLSKYDDKPESYRAWKVCFRTVIDDLAVAPREELDLLVKWLGPESSKHAISIRSSNVNNPERGVLRIWERLDERFGSPENIESALKQKLTNFPKISTRDHKKLYELSDILCEIEAVKEDDKYAALLSYFDSSSGIIPIVNKLPFPIQSKWTQTATNYKRAHNVIFPPFSVFVEFIRNISSMLNDPSFDYQTEKDKVSHPKNIRPTSVAVRKTDFSKSLTDKTINKTVELCPLHNTNHSLSECKAFKAKPLVERKQFLHENKICFRCCGSHWHHFRSCKEPVKCNDCGSDRHPTPLHPQEADSSTKDYTIPMKRHGGEETDPVISKCTQLCGQEFIGRSCAKVSLARIYKKHQPSRFIKAYVLQDDQSNQTLAKTQLFDYFGIPEGQSHEFILSSCSGTQKMFGRVATGFVVESLDGSSMMDLPLILECNDIPDNRSEIPTPEVAKHYSHLVDVSENIPQLDNEAPILLLIGRDLPEAHHVLQQITGPRNSPFAQKLNLGWVIVGEVCLGKQHHPKNINVKKTYISNDGRPTIFPQCPNNFECKELQKTDNLGATVFVRTENDEKIGLSIEDRTFLNIMNSEFTKTASGNWSAPLPFRSPRPKLPNNRPQAVKRSRTLDHSLRRDPEKRTHFLAFMEKIFENGHAERAPNLKANEECWYLPIFGVYHPHKPGQIRGVFDSSATYEGLSLNGVLMSGPNLTNELLGVLQRFRRDPIAVMVDVERMFYCFFVNEKHRNFLRFLWYEDNNFDLPLVEYRMCVHVFGNSPSPAVATYGLRKATTGADLDVINWIKRDFYVDDGLGSFPSHTMAIDTLRRAQRTLKEGGNLRLHKIASNSEIVMNAFPQTDLANDLKDLDLRKDDLPVQRSLGLCWDLNTDIFTYRLSIQNKPITRRGILSTVNSLYDPLGFIAPVVIKGKLLLRTMIAGNEEWDETLPPERTQEWLQWEDSLKHIENITIPRMYTTTTWSQATNKELHVYCDASEKAIAAVAYIKMYDVNNCPQTGFVLGKCKVSPVHGHTIPRLELCAAVLAIEIAEITCEHLDIPSHQVSYHSDSRVVLGYIHNKVRRFYIYVSHRVQRILRFSSPNQWFYVSSDKNPADQGTRSISSQDLQKSSWLMGPEALKLNSEDSYTKPFDYDLIDPDNDGEIRPVIQTKKLAINVRYKLDTHRYTRFSSWKSLVEAIAYLKHIANSFSNPTGSCHHWHSCQIHKDVLLFRQAEKFVIKTVQHGCYCQEIDCLIKRKPLPQNSSIKALSPTLDADGIIRVGGRLNLSNLPINEKNPIIIPKNNWISTLLVRHFHESVKHQGRHFTEGALRFNGYWITGAKRLISSIIHNCVKCKRLRGEPTPQIMADLPSDRLQPCPPFTYVGLDVFGPWQIVTRKTRGGQANSKRWAVLFTCLVTRCIHLEVIEEMSTSSFINSLRRFIALRGKVKEFRSDRGSNFVGATDPLRIDAVNVEDPPFKEYLYKTGVIWKFNPPHSSHMGGVWERMIGIVRRILDSMLLDNKYKHLTHEVLSTLMAEVTIIVNSRPITPVSYDPESPLILTPAALLTHKPDVSEESFNHLDITDMYKSQWKYVQNLSEQFWKRFQREYLPTLQPRTKWYDKRPNLQVNDVVILKDKTTHRNDWSIGIVLKVFPSADKVVRKAEVRTIRGGRPAVFLRPITELVPLLSNNRSNT